MSKCQRELIHKVTTLPAKECSNEAIVLISIPSWAGSAYIYNICEDCQNEMLKYAQEEHEKELKAVYKANYPVDIDKFAEDLTKKIRSQRDRLTL